MEANLTNLRDEVKRQISSVAAKESESARRKREEAAEAKTFDLIKQNSDFHNLRVRIPVLYTDIVFLQGGSSPSHLTSFEGFGDCNVPREVWNLGQLQKAHVSVS